MQHNALLVAKFYQFAFELAQAGCQVGEGFNIATVLCTRPIPFHVNEIKYV